jgi:hypothetical protein
MCTCTAYLNVLRNRQVSQVSFVQTTHAYRRHGFGVQWKVVVGALTRQQLCDLVRQAQLPEVLLGISLHTTASSCHCRLACDGSRPSLPTHARSNQCLWLQIVVLQGQHHLFQTVVVRKRGQPVMQACNNAGRSCAQLALSASAAPLALRLSADAELPNVRDSCCWLPHGRQVHRLCTAGNCALAGCCCLTAAATAVQAAMPRDNTFGSMLFSREDDCCRQLKIEEYGCQAVV